MARPERNNVDYFPHPVAHKKKMFIIEKMFGNDGYAIWFKLLEELGKNNYHYIDLQKDTDVMYLSSICNVEKGVLYGVIDTLITFEEFDLGLWEEERILFNQNFINSIQDAYQKRRNNCVDVNSLRQILLDKGRLKPSNRTRKPNVNPEKEPVNPQRKEKDSKGKDSKGYIHGQKQNCPYQKIIELYNSTLPELPQLTTTTEQIKKTIKARWKEQPDLSWWQWYFEGVKECPFLMGLKTDWQASFTWLIGPKNMAKVLSGEYLDKNKTKKNAGIDAFINGD